MERGHLKKRRIKINLSAKKSFNSDRFFSTTDQNRTSCDDVAGRKYCVGQHELCVIVLILKGHHQFLHFVIKTSRILGVIIG